MLQVVISACICAATARPQFYHPGYVASPYAAVAPIVAAPASQITYDYNIIPDESPAPVAPVAQYAVAPAALPTEYKTQHHSQDEFGQFAYGHASLDQAHSAIRDFTGAVHGSYTYIDANGEEVVAHYIADQDGFRVSSNALPVAPVFEGEAPVAPEFNLEAPVFDLEAPVFDLEAPVFDLAQAEETPEVQAARAEHFRLVEEHKAAVAAALAAAEAPAEEEVAEEEAEETTEAAEEVTEAPAEEEAEVEVEEAAESRRKHQVVVSNQVLFPELYRGLPVEPVELKAESVVEGSPAGLRDAELLKIVHNPGHGTSYRVF